MIEKIDINQHPIEPGSSPGQPNTVETLPGNDADVSVQVNYSFLIEKAMQQPQTDTQVIQRAREMLFSGELESPENIHRAAERIVMLGI
jgi:hypothetical protein